MGTREMGLDPQYFGASLGRLPRAGTNLRQEGQVPPLHVDGWLIWPRGGNTGDMLIVDACMRYLQDRGVTAWCSDGSIEDAAVAGDTNYLRDAFAGFRGMIFFTGGGNIGIYPDNQAVRDAVIRRLGAHHRCLVFSQSAMQAEAALSDARVTVWCRDTASEEILKRAGVRTALVPDMALYMDDAIPKRAGGESIFFIKRASHEMETANHGVTADAASADLTYRTSLDEIISVLEPYDVVVSDRLHGGLIALMMRKKVVLLPVGYHKIRAFYDTWLSDDPGVGFADSQNELAAALAALRSPTGHAAEVFRQRADRAFDRFLLGSTSETERA
jgi:exopolysaccharide biosynthesis predicted pyruvyltransferase EpsI